MLIRELLFADVAALTSHSEERLQHLVDKLSHACKEFGLTISLRKTNILAQGAESPLVMTPSTTQSWRLWTPSPTWAPPCQAQLRSMLRSAAGLPKQLLSWPNSTSECGAMTCREKGPRCASTKPVSCRLSFMAASRGRPMPDKSSNSTDSTSAAFGACCTSGGRTESPTPRSWSTLAK